MITLVTHADTACVGIHYDRASVTEPALFIQSLVDGFTEILSLGGKAAAPSVRG